MQGADQPVPITQMRRYVESQLAAENHQRFRGCALTQNRRRHVTRQDLRAHKYQHRHRKQGQHPEQQPVHNQLSHGMPSVIKEFGTGFAPRLA